MLCTPVEFWRPKRVDTGPIAVVSVFRFSTDTTRSPQMSSTSQHMRSTSPLSERGARIMTHIGPRGWKDPTQRHTKLTQRNNSIIFLLPAWISKFFYTHSQPVRTRQHKRPKQSGQLFFQSTLKYCFMGIMATSTRPINIEQNE